MNWYKKVAWTEGMFMRPQHFQQQDRYFEKFVNLKTTSLGGCAWGVMHLALDQGALKIGKIMISECVGIFEDGTPFEMPGTDPLPDALDISELKEGDLINLCLPLWKKGAVEMDRSQQEVSHARYRIETHSIVDSVAGRSQVADIDVAHKKLRLLPERLVHQHMTTLRIAQVRSVSGNTIELEREFVPPTLHTRGNTTLTSYVHEIAGLLSLRSQLYAQRILNAGTEGAADISDLMLLQISNRYKVLFDHYSQLEHIHPMVVYEQGLSLAAELATFTSDTRLPKDLRGYDHKQLKACFVELIRELNRSLSTLLEQNAHRIELEMKGYGVRVGQIPSNELSDRAYILVVTSDMPKEVLRNKLPTHLKIGPVELITQLVNRHLPGIKVEPMPVAPRQIPYYGGAVYFELQAQGKHWDSISANRSIALHIGEQFPNLEMDLWAIKY
ncbi:MULTISPECIES: type VI secretion system baseplate subunit TssK [Nitrincola]|uniref:Type VI secretion protein, family n=1 Tax=Nitrincola nitratireducens TaxID=1229521 RepID=W9V492_9GAMM|nr:MULTISPECIES: type VI secretion system baseplate subunit TssK [Nitrincola]EXJ10937.1 hypothetical protein D791_02035 [Nitrincola nitratireducens]